MDKKTAKREEQFHLHQESILTLAAFHKSFVSFDFNSASYETIFRFFSDFRRPNQNFKKTKKRI
jgi:hypothetical protein